MAGTKLSGPGARQTPRHTWTTDQRRCLFVLRDEQRFQLTWDDTAAAFNGLFTNEISQTDFPGGVPCLSLKKQYAERERPGKETWSPITKPKSREAEVQRRDHLAAKISVYLGSEEDVRSFICQEPANLPSPSSTESRKRKRFLPARYRDEPPDRDALLHHSPSGVTSLNQAEMVQVSSSEITNRLAYFRFDEDDEWQPSPRTPSKRARTYPRPPSKIAQVNRNNTSALSGLSKIMVRTPNTHSETTPPWTAETFRFVRNIGPALETSSRKRYAEMLEDYSHPSEQEARAPVGGLFFRFWDPSQSHGHNSSNGFIAEKYVRSNAMFSRTYWPPAKHIDPTDVWNHLDGQEIATPFVSVSDSLIWSLSKVLKMVKSGKWKQAKLSIIDARSLPERSVFYAAAFYRGLKRKGSLTKGSHRGISLHEYLIWRGIPASAIIKTWNVPELSATVASSRQLSGMLRFQILMQTGDYQSAIRQILKRGNIALTTDIARLMAKVAQLLGLRHDSMFEHHRHLVSDLIASYKMVVEHHGHESWRAIACQYVHSMCRESDAPVSAKEQAMLKLAFLEGVRLGASHDFRLSRVNATTVQSVQRKTRLIGLEDPSQVVSGEMDAAKLHVTLEQKKQWQVFEARPNRMLLDEDDDDGTGGGDGLEIEADVASEFELDKDEVVMSRPP